MTTTPLGSGPVRTRWGRRTSATAHRDDPPWSSATQTLLVGVGVVLGLVTFFGVLSMPDLAYHPARDLELKATYDTYRETGVLLVKHAGTGSWYGAVEGSTGLVRAVGDDDPGSYLAASLMSRLTGSVSPYPGLRWLVAALCALPLLILPTTVARVFRQARAGVAMLALPLVTWLVNNGTLLIGTEYGMANDIAPTRVYAEYGLAASMVFLSLVLIAHLTTHRLRPGALIAFSCLVVLLASLCNLLRSMSGVGVAVALGVLWWSTWQRKRRYGVAAAVAVVAAVASLVIPAILMDRIDASRREVVSAETSQLADAHTFWHPMYLGLSYPGPITGEASTFGIPWSDDYGLAKAREVDPEVRIGSAEYNAILKSLYLHEVRSRPVAALRLYLEKGLYTVRDVVPLVLLISWGLAVAFRHRGPQRRAVGLITAVAAPTLAYGVLPPVLVMPMLYYYNELIAALGLLSAVALGALVWGIGRPDASGRARNEELTSNGV